MVELDKTFEGWEPLDEDDSASAGQEAEKIAEKAVEFQNEQKEKGIIVSSTHAVEHVLGK